MKDLGELHYFLGIQVVHTSFGLFLSYQKYVLDLFRKLHLHTCTIVRTLFVTQTTLSFFKGEVLVDHFEYWNTVGAL